MADIQFPDVVGTLAPLIQLDRQRDLMRRQDEAERRDQEAGAALPQALAGDKDAQAKVMANPRLGLQFSQYMERADASQRAQLKEASDWQGQAMMAVKNAKPEDKVATYKMALQDGYDRGYGKYLKNMPAEYSPAIEGLLDYHINRHQPYAEYFKGRDSQLVAPPGSGAAPAPAGGPVPPGGDLGRASGAIAGLESGGNYGAVGPDTGSGNKALGKYQVMASNVPTWTAEVLGKPMTPQEFLASPEAQEAVFKGKFGQYLQKYGPEGAARAWFAGEGGMNNAGAKDVLGTSVADYGAKFAKAYGGGPQVAQGPPQMTRIGDMPNGVPTKIGDMPPGQVMPAGGPMPQGGGDALPGQPGTMPQTIDQLNQHPMARELKSLLPPGYVIPVERGTGKIRLQDGVLTVLDPQGNPVQMQLPKLAEPPAGYRPTPSGLEPIPGGPADPARTMADKVPSGYRQKPDATGQLEFIPGGPSDPAIVKRASPMNNEQARDAGFADRMAQAENVLAGVEDQGTKFFERLSEKAPAGAGTYAQSKEYQAFRQARDNFINAQLRRESGAAINKDEYVKADQQYFPQPGDKPEVIQQKALNRKLAVEGMIRGAGPTYQPSPSVPTGGEGPQAAPPPNGAQGPRLSPADAAKLPPGTSFIGMDGVPRVRH